MLPHTLDNLSKKYQQQEIHTRVYLVLQVTTYTLRRLTPSNTMKSQHNHYLWECLTSRELCHPFWLDQFARERLLFSPLGSKPHFSNKILNFWWLSCTTTASGPLGLCQLHMNPFLGCVGLCAASLMLLLLFCLILFGSKILFYPNLYFYPSDYNLDH